MSADCQYMGNLQQHRIAGQHHKLFNTVCARVRAHAYTRAHTHTHAHPAPSSPELLAPCPLTSILSWHRCPGAYLHLELDW